MGKDKAFVFSDPHGCYDTMMKLLKNWDKENEELVILGDLVDRGLQSKEVLQFAYVCMSEGATVLLGNHDKMLLDFLNLSVLEADFIDMYLVWYYQGGRDTAASILGMSPAHVDTYTPARLKEALLEHEYVLDTLALLERYYEFGNVLFVHAGVPVEYQSHWRDTPLFDMIWHRGVQTEPNDTGKIIVCGHTPTRGVHRGGSDDIWVRGTRDLIMVDGGCAYDGQLNAIVIDRNGNIEKTYSEKHT